MKIRNGVAFAAWKAIGSARAKLFTEGDAQAEKPACSLQPSALMQMVLDEATRRGMSWADTVEFPTSYDVYVSTADWNCFYGLRVSSTERRLAEAIVFHAEEQGAITESAPVVRLKNDASLREGEARVVATFEVPAKKTSAERASRKAANNNPREAFIGRLGDTQLMEGASGRVSPMAVTPRLVPHAVLAYGELKFDISPGKTIGILRDGSGPLPDIALPYSDELQYVSQVHGRFECDDEGSWSFVNESKNGASVTRGGETFSVEGSVVLADGDKISLAGSKPMLFSPVERKE